LSEFQSALVELRIADLSIGVSAGAASHYWNAGKYLTKNFPIGHELHAEGLDALYSYYMIIGPIQATIDIAEHQLNPENIKATARRAMKEEASPLCEANVHVLQYYLIATSNTRDTTTYQKRLTAENEILNSYNTCLDKDTEASILHDLIADSIAVGDLSTAVNTARQLVNEFSDYKDARSAIGLRKEYAHTLRLSGNTAEGISQIEIARDLANKSGEIGWGDNLLQDLAIILIDDGQLDRAEQILVQLISENSEAGILADLHSRLSAIAERKEEYSNCNFLQKISLKYAITDQRNIH